MNASTRMPRHCCQRSKKANMDTMNSEYTSGESQYRIVRFSEEAIPDVQYLFSKCFGTDPGKEAIRKKHAHCHGNHTYIGFIAYPINSSTPAAFYTVFPTYITNGSTKVLAAQSGDTMTHPDHQKKGLFVFLAEKTFSLCLELDISLIFGFPNDQSFPGFVNRLHFTPLPNLDDFSFIENRLEVHRWCSKLRWTSHLQLMWAQLLIRLFSKRIRSYQREYHSESTQVFYDQSYRMTKSGRYHWISIFGAHFWIKIQGNTLMIGDISYTNPSTFKKQISILRWLTVLSGNRFLSFSATPNHPTNSVLKRAGILPQNNRQRLIVRYLKPINLPGDFIFTCADIDVF
jgi:hypothetical protein